MISWRISKIIFVALVAIFGMAIVWPRTSFAATGDIIAVRLHTDGWYLEVDVEGLNAGGTYDFGLGTNNDPTNAKVVLTVTSPGYDANGDVTSLTRTVYGTRAMRKAYPNDAQLDETSAEGTLTVKVALSDFIYPSDTATISIASGWLTETGVPTNTLTDLAVTNNSTLSYPKVIGRWAWPGYERVTDDFLVEALAFHRFAQNGKPVALVRFTASDQHGNTVTVDSTEMTKTTRTGDANVVLVYAATIPVATLTQGDVITVNFKAYPWVGDAMATLNSDLVANDGDGFAQPSEQLGPLYEVNDKEGTYGVGYALVSPTGNDTTGVVYSSQGAAEAGSAYLTIGAAMAGIKTYHTNTFSRSDAGGGVILLTEGSYVWPGSAVVDLGTMNAWLIVKPAAGATKANTIINGGPNTALKATRVKVEGVTISSASVNVFQGRTASDALWIHNNSLNFTGTVFAYKYLADYATQNTITALTGGFTFFSTNKTPWALVRGNNNPTSISGAHFYTVIGNNNVSCGFQESTNAAGQVATSNAVCGFNSVFKRTTTLGEWAKTTDTFGLAVVQNVFEMTTNATPLFQLAADSSTATTSNILLWHNTMTGQRANLGYNEYNETNVPRLNWSQKFNVYQQWNNKDDTFGGGPPNGVRKGSWPIGYNIGSVGHVSQNSLFRGEFDGLYSMWGPTSGNLDIKYTRDGSYTGGGAGNGDYTLRATSAAIDLVTNASSRDQVLPFDFLGNPIYGSPDVGAYEYQPPYTMGTHQVATSSVVRVYGDEKWRVKTATTTDGVADLNISIPGSDTSKWLDISVSLWNTDGDYHKTWTETSSTTALTNTVHVVGDLKSDARYNVAIDSVVGQNISGDDCTSGVCTANGSGQITFTYTGTYSVHTFDITQNGDDVIPPTPGSVSFSNVTDTSITVLSSGAEDETALAALPYQFRNVTDDAYTSATSSTSWLVTGLTPETAYTFEIGVQDLAGNWATTTQAATTTPAETPVDSTPPVLSSGAPSGSQSAGTTQITLQVSTNESATCKYGTTANTAYADIANTFSTTGGTTHTQTITGLSNGTSYTYYIRCTDGSNPNTSDYTISFSIASPASGGSISSSGSINPNFLRQVTPPPVTPTLPAFTFTRDLKLGMTGTDVRSLQVFLNTHGYTVAAADAGSIGQETTYFGPATQAALIRYQRVNNITPAIGYFGPVSRAAVYLASLSPAQSTASSTPTATTTPVSLSPSHTFTIPLSLGQTHLDVLVLQRFLNTDPETRIAQIGIGSPGHETTYFGNLTLDAVKRFQIKYDIAKLGNSGFGHVGPATRAMLNELGAR